MLECVWSFWWFCKISKYLAVLGQKSVGVGRQVVGTLDDLGVGRQVVGCLPN